MTKINAPDYSNRLRKVDWEVRPAPLSDGQALVAQHHYARGGSNTCVYMHGLYPLGGGALMGVAWWLPPTKVAAQSVNRREWQRVLSLTRMVILPDVPQNAASFLLSRSVKLIAAEGRFRSLVTYADEYMGHTGGVYKSAGWEYVGRTGPYVKWHTSEGRQVAAKATRTRSKVEMLALGHTRVGSFHKHKYVKHLTNIQTLTITAEQEG